MPVSSFSSSYGSYPCQILTTSWHYIIILFTAALSDLIVVTENRVLRFITMISSSYLGPFFMGYFHAKYSPLHYIYLSLLWCGLDIKGFLLLSCLVLPCSFSFMENFNIGDLFESWDSASYVTATSWKALVFHCLPPLRFTILSHIRKWRHKQHSNYICVAMVKL